MSPRNKILGRCVLGSYYVIRALIMEINAGSMRENYNDEMMISPVFWLTQIINGFKALARRIKINFLIINPAIKTQKETDMF